MKGKGESEAMRMRRTHSILEVTSSMLEGSETALIKINYHRNRWSDLTTPVIACTKPKRINSHISPQK